MINEKIEELNQILKDIEQENISKAAKLFKKHKIMASTHWLLAESRTIYLKYVELNEDEQEELIDLIIREMDFEGINKGIEYMLLYIASFTRGHSLKKIYPRLIKEKSFHFSEVYLWAGDAEVELLLQAMNEDSNDENAIMDCLGHISSTKAIEFFSSLPEHKQMHTQNGGWTLDNNKEIRKLFSDKVIAFGQSTDSSDNMKSEIAPLNQSEVKCEYCRNNLTVVYREDYEMATCLFCNCYEPISTKINGDGKAMWHESNKMDSFLENMLAERGGEAIPTEYYLEESKEARLPAFSMSEYVNIPLSQIGGMPTWLNDPYYPRCPECGELMVFIAQFDIADALEFGEGIYYFFHCAECNVITADYGQT